jgi:single-strand DNA-binding protein
MIRAAIHGRIGSDPVQRETRNGKSMVTASVAVNVAKPTEEAATEWVSLVAFGAVGESLARHAKGDVITAMGPLTKSTFAGRDGAERSNWSLLAESVLSARTVNGRPRERRDTNAATRPRGVRSSARSFYSAPQQSGRASAPDLPDDGVGDLWR